MWIEKLFNIIEHIATFLGVIFISVTLAQIVIILITLGFNWNIPLWLLFIIGYSIATTVCKIVYGNN